MIITVFGATGQVGRRIVRYALAKEHTVRAFGRNVTELIDEDNRSEKLEAIKGSVFDDKDIARVIKGADVVMSALGGAFAGDDRTRSLGMKKIVAQMEKLGLKRIIAVGGMGTLSTTEGEFILDTPEYPQEYLAVGQEHMEAYKHLEGSKLDWTFVCPPNIKDEDATKHYVVSDTYLPEPNMYFITAGDIAHFMVNEAEQNNHLRQRVGMSAA